MKSVTAEKKRQKKKIDPKAVLRASSAIQEALTRATEMQAALMKSSVIQDTMRAQATMQEAIRRSTMGIQAMARYHDEINRRIARIAQVSLESFYRPQAMKGLMEVRQSAQRLVEQYVKIQDMVQRSVPKLALIPELEAIPPRSERAIQSLYNYIAILEAELARKEEELAKNDKEIRELIRLLKEGKKEFKEKYIA